MKSAVWLTVGVGMTFALGVAFEMNGRTPRTHLEKDL